MANLTELIERARSHKMTAAEVFEQRVSFCYAQQDWSAPVQRTKDEIRAQLAEMYGAPS